MFTLTGFCGLWPVAVVVVDVYIAIHGTVIDTEDERKLTESYLLSWNIRTSLGEEVCIGANGVQVFGNPTLHGTYYLRAYVYRLRMFPSYDVSSGTGGFSSWLFGQTCILSPCESREE